MKQSTLLFILMAISTIFGCEKADECYDKQMEQNHSGICPQDCPGVCGCDGQTYCNECIANSKGISIVTDGSCNQK